MIFSFRDWPVRRAVSLANLFSGKPILAVFDITRDCQSRCPMCNIRRAVNGGREMDLTEITRLAGSLRRFGISYVFLQGGEPLLRQDLLKIVDIFIAGGIKPTIITNGILLNTESACALSRRNCNLSVSLDTLDREKYARIRGVDAFDIVTANIARCASLKRRKKGNWSVISTITALSTLEDVMATERFARANGFMYAVRPYVFSGSSAGARVDELVYERKKVVPIFEYMLSKARRGNYLAGLLYEEHLRYLRGESMSACDAMKYSVRVDETGVFFPCLELTACGFLLNDFRKAKTDFSERITACNRNAPCFFNCAREVGILWNKKWRIALNIPRIAGEMLREGNFF